jgi:hypothetical protein
MDVAEKVFADKKDIYSATWRWEIFTTYSIVHNVRIDPKNAFKWENFKAFIMKNISDGLKLFSREKKAEEGTGVVFEDLAQKMAVEVE